MEGRRCEIVIGPLDFIAKLHMHILMFWGDISESYDGDIMGAYDAGLEMARSS